MSTNVPISSITLSSAVSSITFTGIPQTYTDLFITADGYNATGDFFTTIIRFNGDSATNYSRTRLVGTGSSANTSRLTNQTGATINSALGWGTNNTGSGNMIINIPNYSNTTTFKTILSRSNTAASGVELNLLTWRSTSAITDIEMWTNGATFRAGSTFNLYGINAANSAQAKATGGDSIYRDTSYWYHVFNKSGTFTPSQSLSNVDYLVVAGGGGGGAGETNNSIGGGGGAGGLRSSVTATGGGGSLESSLTVNAAVTVTVGAGGTAPQTAGAVGGNGSNSVFSTITSTGGGGGGASNINGSTGGSGGGGAVIKTGGSGTSNQGYAGGNGGNASTGGGGGAGAVGANGSGTQGGNGGNGVASSISGSSVTYAGGGGGGTDDSGTVPTGGTGGGGTGSKKNAGNATAGTANTGGGGGGGAAGTTTNQYGGNGGSGIVIVRYPV